MVSFAEGAASGGDPCTRRAPGAHRASRQFLKMRVWVPRSPCHWSPGHKKPVNGRYNCTSPLTISPAGAAETACRTCTSGRTAWAHPAQRIPKPPRASRRAGFGIGHRVRSELHFRLWDKEQSDTQKDSTAEKHETGLGCPIVPVPSRLSLPALHSGGRDFWVVHSLARNSLARFFSNRA